MPEDRPAHLPGYASDATKAALLAAGASGTIYSLVMPESEAALAHVADGGDRAILLADGPAEEGSPGSIRRGMSIISASVTSRGRMRRLDVSPEQGIRLTRLLDGPR
jgi:hypothetical protein